MESFPTLPAPPPPSPLWTAASVLGLAQTPRVGSVFRPISPQLRGWSRGHPSRHSTVGYTVKPRGMYICYNCWTYTDIIIMQRPQFTLRFTGVMHSMGLGKWIMTCIHHYSIIQGGFTTLKILCALLIHPSHPPTPGNHGSFCCLQVLPFPECHKLESYKM